jgi:hypothetical protein
MQQKVEGRFRCDCCLRGWDNEKAMRCEKCDADICEMCVQRLKNAEKRMMWCGKGHRMAWKSNVVDVYALIRGEECYFCWKCRGKFEKIGSYSCLVCKNDVCLNCSNLCSA